MHPAGLKLCSLELTGLFFNIKICQDEWIEIETSWPQGLHWQNTAVPVLPDLKVFWDGTDSKQESSLSAQQKAIYSSSWKGKSIWVFKNTKILPLVHEFPESGIRSSWEYTRNECLSSWCDDGGWCLGLKAAQLCSFTLLEEVTPAQSFPLSYKALSQICEAK